MPATWCGPEFIFDRGIGECHKMFAGEHGTAAILFTLMYVDAGIVSNKPPTCTKCGNVAILRASRCAWECRRRGSGGDQCFARFNVLITSPFLVEHGITNPRLLRNWFIFTLHYLTA